MNIQNNNSPSLSDPDSPTNRSMIITIIGGGNSGHVCSSLIHNNSKGKFKVQLFTSKPEAWTKNPLVRFPDGSTQIGELSLISSDPSEVLPQSDLVLWTGPVNATRQVFETIRPYINPKKTTIGMIFAQGLIHLLAVKIFGPDMKFIALRNIPWLCRLTDRGRECEIVGPKSSIEAVVINLSTKWVKRVAEPLFVVQSTGKWEPIINIETDFCPIVFNPANQIIHPARYWGLFRWWTPGSFLSNDKEPNPWLYRDMDELSGTVLQALDDELQAIKNAYYDKTGYKSCNTVIPLRERLIIQYGSQIKDQTTMAKLIGTNAAYAMAKTPIIRTAEGVSPDPNHRVVLDDIGWGLCVLISIAIRLNIPCNMMTMLVEWHQTMMNKEYLINGKLIGKDCGELVFIGPDDDLDLVANPPKSLINLQLLENADRQSEEFRIGNP